MYMDRYNLTFLYILWSNDFFPAAPDVGGVEGPSAVATHVWRPCSECTVRPAASIHLELSSPRGLALGSEASGRCYQGLASAPRFYAPSRRLAGRRLSPSDITHILSCTAWHNVRIYLHRQHTKRNMLIFCILCILQMLCFAYLVIFQPDIGQQDIFSFSHPNIQHIVCWFCIRLHIYDA